MSKRLALVLCTVGMLLALSTLPVAAAQSDDAEASDSITRIMMLPPEAEVTGMLVDDNGLLCQRHAPRSDHYKATVGVVHGVDWNNLLTSCPNCRPPAAHKTSGTACAPPTAPTRCSCKTAMP